MSDSARSVVIVESLTYILPEVVLVGMACLHFLFGPFLIPEGREAPAGVRHRWGLAALVAFLTAGVIWWTSRTDLVAEGFYGPFRLDNFAWYIRGLTIAGGIVLLLTSWNQVDNAHAAESHALLMLIVAGVNLSAAANDLVGLFLALELVSIPTYVLLYLQRRDSFAQEATLKYFLLSIFSSALVLYGFSFLYGVTGTTNLAAVHDALWNAPPGPPAVLSIALVAIIAGLSFRVTAVPFHFYAPDVFQGTGTPAAALLAFVPKVVGFVALLRIFATPIAGSAPPHWTLLEQGLPVLWVLAVVTMFVGNLMALAQTNIKRLLAYSSIAHAGYMLVGFTVGRDAAAAADGVEALLFYIAVYGAMTVGVFAALVYLSRPGRPIENIDDLAGISRTNPGVALLTAVFLFSLTGLPPTAGFFGKLNLFLAAWLQGTPSAHWLAAILALNAAIGAWYYLRVIAVMYLQPPAGVPSKVRWNEFPALMSMVLCVVATIGLFFSPNLLWKIIEQITT